jgi:TolB protein
MRKMLLTFSVFSLIILGAGLFQEHRDIGVTPRKGDVQYDSRTGEYRVMGGGANMWFKTDAFHFVYQQITGDVSLAADVHFVGQGAEQHRKAALMIRQSLEAGSPYADIALHGDGLTSLQYRPGAGVDTEEARVSAKAPARIRIERHGNEFMVTAGNPGEQPQIAGPIIVTMQDPVYVGLAMCSHNAEILETAVFSNIELRTARKQ